MKIFTGLHTETLTMGETCSIYLGSLVTWSSHNLVVHNDPSQKKVNFSKRATLVSQ